MRTCIETTRGGLVGHLRQHSPRGSRDRHCPISRQAGRPLDLAVPEIARYYPVDRSLAGMSSPQPLQSQTSEAGFGDGATKQQANPQSVRHADRLFA